MPEIEKALTELKRLMTYRIEHAETDAQREKEQGFTGLGLTSRKNLCLHPSVRVIDLLPVRYMSYFIFIFLGSRSAKRRKAAS